MHGIRLGSAMVLVACAVPHPAHGMARPLQDGASVQHDDCAREIALLNESEIACRASDFTTARAKSEQAVTALFERPQSERDAKWLKVMDLAGWLARNAHDARTANRAFQCVLDIRARTLSDDDPELQTARENVADTLTALKDIAGARILDEKVLEVRTRTLADDDPILQGSRANLAETLTLLGEHARAQALHEKVLEVAQRTLPDDDDFVQLARQNLATSMFSQGEFEGARTLYQKVLDVLARKLPDDHVDLLLARQNLAAVMYALGDYSGARALEEKVLELRARMLPDDHPELQASRSNLAATIAMQASSDASARPQARQRCIELIGANCRAQLRVAHDALLTSPGRATEELCFRAARRVDSALSFALGYGVFDPDDGLCDQAFRLEETTRGAAILSASLARTARANPRYAERRDALSHASAALAELAYADITREEFDRAIAARELAERELVALAREQSGGERAAIEVDAASLAAALDERTAAVGFRRFLKTKLARVESSEAALPRTARESSVESLCAFVVHGKRHGLALVDLGSIAPIENAVRAWRESIGIGAGGRGFAAGDSETPVADEHAPGRALRQLVFDPLLPVLGGAQHIVVALDDVLCLVALDALPLDDEAIVGDRYRIDTRTTLLELLEKHAPFSDAGRLLAIGDVDYSSAEEHESRPTMAADAGDLHGWHASFAPLPATGVEVRGIAHTFARGFGEAAPFDLCERERATREHLLALAPPARWLHIATHGWFAPESIASWNDAVALPLASSQEQVDGMSPMLLCGLALAGAGGMITADELSTLDLSNCELAVLSACDTNVGVRRAGQGVASLQKALQMAGARSVITSLWKVPDEATKDLMLDFYRRLWVGKTPKWRALFEAKCSLRDAKDASGKPKYATRDWAAWVLTGAPD